VLEAFFSRIHGKPFYILDESDTRQKYQLGQLASHLAMAIYAITVKSVSPRHNGRMFRFPFLSFPS